MYSIVTQIIDNDPNGERKGTVYKLTVSKQNEIVEVIEYSIMDILKGFTKHIDLISHYRQLNEKRRADRDHERNVNLQQVKEERLSKSLAEIDVTQRELIQAVVRSHPEIIQQYKQGNEKSINVLMGKLLKQIKMDPQVLLIVIKQVIGE